MNPTPATPESDSTHASLGERLFLPALLVVGAGLGLLLGIWFFSPPAEGIPSTLPTAGYTAITAAPAPVVGAPAPDFLLKDMQGRAVQLSNLRGAPVLIAFWATWCEPCRVEMPMLNEETARLKVLAVNYGEPNETASAYVQALQLDRLTILLDPNLEARDRYLVNALPTSFLVDENGIIRFLKIGLLEKSELETALAALGGTH